MQSTRCAAALPELQPPRLPCCAEAFDCVACAYGHVLRSNLHHASWCGYVKVRSNADGICGLEQLMRQSRAGA